MDVAREHCYRFNILLLSILGLWPYGNRNLRLTQKFTCIGFLSGGLIAQLLPIITIDYSMTLFLQNVSLIAITLDLLLKYLGFCFHADYLKEIIEGINADWSGLADENELQIITMHSKKGRSCTKLFTGLVYIVAICLIICQFSPIFLDMIMPLNESRPLELPVMTETFVTGKWKFYIFVVPFNAEMMVTGTTFVATESIHVMFLHHAKALFEIVSYRIKTFDELSELTNCEGKASIQYLRQAIHMHGRAINYTTSLANQFRTMTGIQYLCGVISLSTNLLRFTRAISTSHALDEILPSASMSSGVLVYLFYTNYIAQTIVDQADNISHSTYQTRWYEAPVSVQKLFLVILIKGMRPCTLNIMGNVGKSMEDFSRVLQMSWSYFMVLHSSTTI